MYQCKTLIVNGIGKGIRISVKRDQTAAWPEPGKYLPAMPATAESRIGINAIKASSLAVSAVHRTAKGACREQGINAFL